MATVTMADSSKYSCYYGGRPWPGQAYITLTGKTMMETVGIMSDQAKTSRMEVKDIGTDEVLIGYTELAGVVNEPMGIRAIMKVPENE